MIDFIWRAVINPRDYANVIKKNTLIFSEHIDEGSGNHSFIFNCTSTLHWKAGQHGIFSMPKQNVVGKKWRAFSIASSPLEKVIRIGTSIPIAPSDFKQKLLGLQPGDEITMRGPFGEFYLDQTAKQVVAIAGGIGITPLRAIMLEIANDLHPDVTIELIYAGKNDFFTYNDSCEEFAAHPSIGITYVNTPDEVNNSIDQAVAKYGNAASYYISGSPGMIMVIRKRLKDAGISKIVNDPFKGY